jgi:hypothetical protein
MEIQKQDKIAIAARNFYDDQVGTDDAFDSYEQAIEEMSKVSEDFIDTVVNFMNFNKLDGYRMLMRDGYVIQVNSDTGHVLPVSAISDDYGNKLQKDFEDISMQHESIESAIVLLQKLGWKLL